VAVVEVMQILGLEVLNIMKRFSIVLLVFLLPLNLFIIVGGCSEENELTEGTEMKQEEIRKNKIKKN
jgi:hypothetical protein